MNFGIFVLSLTLAPSDTEPLKGLCRFRACDILSLFLSVALGLRQTLKMCPAQSACPVPLLSSLAFLLLGTCSSTAFFYPFA